MRRRAIDWVLAVVTLAMLAGCQAQPWKPSNKLTMVTETTSQSEPNSFSAAQNAPEGTVYLYDATDQRLIYTGLVHPNDAVRLYSNHAVIIPADASGAVSGDQAIDPFIVARYPQGHHVQAYVLKATTSKR